MAGQAGILDSPEQRVRYVFPGGGRDPGRCESSAPALPWTPAFAGERAQWKVGR
jgi:hypothetical protein